MIKVRAIIEVVGKPQEHVKETLNLIIKHVADDRKVKLESREIYKPEPVENFFSAFAEIGVSFQEPRSLLSFCFDYMPSSVEITEPDEFDLDSKSFSNLLNDLVGRLHSINSKMTNKNAENKILAKNAESLLKNLIHTSLESGSLDITKLSRKVGIKPEKLEEILKRIDDIKQEGGKYTLK